MSSLKHIKRRQISKVVNKKIKKVYKFTKLHTLFLTVINNCQKFQNHDNTSFYIYFDKLFYTYEHLNIPNNKKNNFINKNNK